MVYDEKNMRVDLEKLSSTDTGDQLIFDAMIDTFDEYVIGPELHAKNDFYR